MDLDQLLREFDHRQSVLGGSKGGVGTPVVWVSLQQAQPLCAALRTRCIPEFDRLEAILCVEVEQTLMLTYLVKNSAEDQLLGIRVSVPTREIAKEVSVLSVAHLWLEALAHENELSALYGIRFVETSPDAPQAWVRSIPTNLDFGGFPMRKQFSYRRVDA